MYLQQQLAVAQQSPPAARKRTLLSPDNSVTVLFIR
jgi:hypothetical protein